MCSPSPPRAEAPRRTPPRAAAWFEPEDDGPPPSTSPSTSNATTLDLSNRSLNNASLRLLPDTLTCLDLTRCAMQSLDALGRLPRLELLNVSYNKLVSLDGLQSSRGLKVCFARSNRISSLASIDVLTALQRCASVRPRPSHAARPPRLAARNG